MATLDIILPAYNPLPGWEENVIRRFLSLRQAMPELQMTLIVVNDGSTQMDEKGAHQKIKASLPGLKWVSYTENRGKGYALRKGVEGAESDYILYTDVDFPYDEESMTGLIRQLTEGSDAVIGIRDDGYYAQLPAARRRISKLLRRINGRILRLKVNDTQAGLKGFRQRVRPVFLSTTINRYLFDLEFVYLLSQKDHFQISSIPITLRPGISFSKMNRKILIEEARNFFKIWIRRK